MLKFPKKIMAFCRKDGRTDFDADLLFPTGASAEYVLSEPLSDFYITGPNSRGNYWLHSRAGFGCNLGSEGAGQQLALALRNALPAPEQSNDWSHRPHCKDNTA